MSNSEKAKRITNEFFGSDVTDYEGDDIRGDDNIAIAIVSYLSDRLDRKDEGQDDERGWGNWELKHYDRIERILRELIKAALDEKDAEYARKDDEAKRQALKAVVLGLEFKEKLAAAQEKCEEYEKNQDIHTIGLREELKKAQERVKELETVMHFEKEDLRRIIDKFIATDPVMVIPAKVAIGRSIYRMKEALADAEKPEQAEGE